MSIEDPTANVVASEEVVRASVPSRRSRLPRRFDVMVALGLAAVLLIAVVATVVRIIA